jgi:hypothetical protein
VVTVVELLERDAEELIDRAVEAVSRAHLSHYEDQGEGELRRRVTALYELLRGCLSRNDAMPMIEHARRVAEERFADGFGLEEVQTAFNAIEETVWTRVLTSMPPAEFARGIGLVSTVLGLGKDALARAYVSLATRTHAPSLDLRGLFRGAEGD